MTGNQIRTSYIHFFEQHQHKLVNSASLVPQNDPTTLFTSSGMQPLLPYFLGEIHPLGTRIVNSQKCFRAEDIEEIGDNRHTTFFEMLGNWSFGDYFKTEQLHFLYTWLTEELKLDPNNLVVSVFGGNDTMPRDEETVKIWQELFESNLPAKQGISGYDSNIKIYEYGVKKNWWSRAGTPDEMPEGEPGGTTSEIFFRFDQVEHDPKYGKVCHPNCDCGRFIEIGNSVFMEFMKVADGKFEPLPHRNIDFGGGLERLTAAVTNTPDVFETDLFKPLITKLEDKSNLPYIAKNREPMRIIADHLRGSVMMMAEGITPSNKEQGYIVRRLLRRAIVQADRLGMETNFLTDMVPEVASYFSNIYPEVQKNQTTIQSLIGEEEVKFRRAILQGKKVLKQKISHHNNLRDQDVSQLLFNLYQSYGLPLEISQVMTAQLLGIENVGSTIWQQYFDELKSVHADSSRTSTKGMFKGGLQDNSEVIVKYHTCTHLLHQALRQILGNHVEQMGSNITGDRLRFDFKHQAKLSSKELREIEEEINQAIAGNLSVKKTIENKDTAIASGALAFFKETYPAMVSVYTIGEQSNGSFYSKELCGGPHVKRTGEIGPIKIIKEQSVGARVRRIYLKLAENKNLD
jgi:alanyl-tRNA synthetase